MIPLSEHQLLVFWLQLALLVSVARGLGGLMHRIGQPPVVGELAAGLLIGPSVLGRVAPGVFEFLFPAGDAVQSGLILAVAWVGVALLLVITGFETDLELLRHLGRSSAYVSVGSLVVPLVVGFGLGWLIPEVFIGPEGGRIGFAGFMAVAMSISALPVVAKILIDMDLMRRNVGQVTVAAGMANDLIGWLLLGVLAGVVSGGGFELTSLLVTVGSIGLFLVGMLTVGQKAVDWALRRARRGAGGMVSTFTVVILATLFAGALTQAIGVEAVLGAFVAGIVLGRSRYQQPEIERSLEVVVSSFLAPVFFATAGLSVDLGLLADPETLFWTVVVIAVAAAVKLVGSFVGARLGGMPAREGLAVGIGLNARGALEIIIATIGLSLGVLNTRSFTIVVVMAMVTSIMAPPLLRRVLRSAEATPDEAARLQREKLMSQSVIAKTKTALLPTRGGENSVLAARLLDRSLQPDASVTVFTVHREGDQDQRRAGAEAAAAVRSIFGERRTEHIDESSDDAVAAICREAGLGYGLVAFGMSEGYAGGQAGSPVLRALLSRCPVPMLLVQHGRGHERGTVPDLGHIVVPAPGTELGRAAQEIAFTVAASSGSTVDLVHVLSRPDQVPRLLAGRSLLAAAKRPSQRTADSVTGVLGAATALAEQFGCQTRPVIRSGESVGRELIATAEEERAGLIVLAGRVRSFDGEPFLGHVVEYLLEHASMTVLVLVFPERPQPGE